MEKTTTGTVRDILAVHGVPVDGVVVTADRGGVLNPAGTSGEIHRRDYQNDWHYLGSWVLKQDGGLSICYLTEHGKEPYVEYMQGGR